MTVPDAAASHAEAPVTHADTAAARGILTALLLTAIAVTFGLVLITRIGSQSRRNQEHIDCVVAVLLKTDPPQCRSVHDQLIRDGIIHP